MRLACLIPLCFPLLASALDITAPGRAGIDSAIDVSLSETQDPRAYVTIVKPDAAEGSYDDYVYTDRNPLSIRTPAVAGTYELRVSAAEAPHATLARRPIEVFKPEARITAPATARVTEVLSIGWSGPSGNRAYITLVPAALADGEYREYEYLEAGKASGTVTLTTPSAPGDYELRYATDRGSVLARQPLTVGDLAATLSFPATVAMGGKIDIGWTGPENARNYLTIVPADAPAESYKDYVYTTKPSLSLVVPEQPGAYEVRLLSADGKRVLARGPLQVGAATASLDAVASAEAGSEIRVIWQGPDNAGDYIAVTQIGKPEKYLKFAYTQHGSPLKLQMPDQAGQYELHYLTARSSQSLASRALTVTPATGVGSLKVSRASSEVRSTQGASAGVSAGGEEAGSIALILDASGSMLQRLGDQRRIDLAQAALTRLIDTRIAPGTPVALRVFGHLNPGGCETELVAPLAPLDRARMGAQVRAIAARNLAKTAIGASLAATAEDLAGVEGRALIVLVTDGEETCGGDPEREIRKLKESGFDFALNIVGFAIDQAGLEQDFQRWAALGDGRYFSAANGDALTAMIQQASQSGPASFVVLRAGAQVASGEVGAQAINLKPGSYELVVGDRRQNIEIVSGAETRVAID